MSNDTTDDTLKSLELLYSQGEFAKAQKLLLENQAKFDRGLYHYNLGTIHLKNGEAAAARYHFEKALKHGFVNPYVLNNLRSAQEKLMVATVEQADSLGDVILNAAIAMPKHLPVTVCLVLITVYLGLLKFKVFAFKRWVLGIFLGLLITPFLLSALMMKNTSSAVVLAKTEVKEGPSQIFAKTYELPAGIRIIVDGPENGWYFVKSPTRLAGWVTGKELGFL